MSRTISESNFLFPCLVMTNRAMFAIYTLPITASRRYTVLVYNHTAINIVKYKQ